MATTTLAGGCFWCLEAVFLRLRGVQRVESGYAGGHLDNPTYRAVCSGTTGHAEVVQVEFDPQEISYRELLEVFFAIHDPTTLNRQGADVGTQYRSAIFYHDDAQMQDAEAMIRALADDNKILLGQLREVKATAEADGDIATSGLVDGWADETQQRIWFLEATLGY